MLCSKRANGVSADTCRGFNEHGCGLSAFDVGS